MVPLLSILSVIACLVAKMFLALKVKAHGKKLGRERDIYHEARKEFGTVAVKMKLLNTKGKHIEIKRKRTKDHINRASKSSLNTFVDEKNKVRAKAKAQEDLMKEAKRTFLITEADDGYRTFRVENHPDRRGS